MPLLTMVNIMKIDKSDYRFIAHNLETFEFRTESEAIDFKNTLFLNNRERCLADINKMLAETGEKKIRRIRLFNNIQIFTKVIYDVTGLPIKPGLPDTNWNWGIRFLFDPDELMSTFHTFTMPSGDPARMTSWIILFSAHDENLEPISPLICNGGITIYPTEE